MSTSSARDRCASSSATSASAEPGAARQRESGRGRRPPRGAPRGVVVERSVGLGRVPQQADDRASRAACVGRLRAGRNGSGGWPRARRRRRPASAATRAVPAASGDPLAARRRRGLGQRVARGARLQDLAQCVDLLEVLDTQLGDEVASPRPVGHLSLLLEHPQGLAHGSDADAEPLGNVLLNDPLPGPQLAGHDRAGAAVQRMLGRRLWRDVDARAAVDRAASSSAERLDAGQRAADDERVDVGGALVGDAPTRGCSCAGSPGTRA